MTAHKLAIPDSLRPFWERHELLLLSGIFALGLLIRLSWLGVDFNITADLPILRSWIVTLQEEGLTGFYGTVGERTYPPLSIYLLAAGGWLADKLSSSAVPDESLLNALIKLPAILADVGTAALLVWQAAKQTAAWRILITGLYLLNPAVWYVSIYWGQTDAIYLFFLFAALLLLARGAVVPAWLCYALSLAVKLQALPLVFLFLAWTLVYYGRRVLLKGLVAGGAAGLILMLPWLLNGRLLGVITATLSSSSRVVQSAYNGWYFLLRDQAGTAEASRSLGILPFSYQTISLLLFLIAVFVVTILIVRHKEQLSLPIAAVVLTLTAFLFLTDIRERYLFPVLPLLLWGAGQQRRLLWFYLILTATWLFNLVTIASFAPELWTNLVAWPRPYPTHIALLKTIAWVVSAVHLAIYFWLASFLIVVK
jgi:Gpi18-like mannosyltransferase